MKNIYKYKFSVIMPLYNIEEFFEEAIDSIIGQTLGFEENIQIILVNDGSPDNVEDLCLKYKALYPENIQYIVKENGGVSSARNEGIKHIQGKYVNFFDADDKWALEAFEKGYAFLEKHTDVDVVSCRHCFFGKREGFIHPLDYKFTQEQVIDIHEEYTYIQMAANAAFIRSTALQDVWFDTRLKISEDSIFMTKIILKKEKCGTLPEAVYHYRKRLSNDSALDFSTTSRTWYFDTPEYCYKELFRYSKEKYGEVIPYIQYLVMYDIQWRLKILMPDDFTTEERERYKTYLVDLIKEMDDDIIWEQKSLILFYRIFALGLKHGEDVLKNAQLEKTWLVYRGLKVFNVGSRNCLNINILDIEGDQMFLVGETTLRHLGDIEVFIRDNKENDYPVELYDIGHGDRFVFTGDTLFRRTGFKASLPLGFKKTYRVIVKVAGEEITLKPKFNVYGRLNHELAHSYYVHGKYLIKYEKNRIKCFVNRRKSHFASELKFMGDLLSHKKLGMIFYRFIYYLFKIVVKKQIWMIADRTNAAGDNGAALFRYLNEEGIDSINAYFFMYKKTKDFKEMKKIGHVLALDSMHYKLKFLLADKIISSHFDDWVVGAFGRDKKYVKDLCKFDFVFLQHGVIQNDLSAWLYKQRKNIKLFVTSSQAERDSILNGNYGYTDREVKLLGLPRHDYLTSEREKRIIFLPTWRHNIALPANKQKGVRPYSENFKYTEYFLFYNRLINDPRLIMEMKNVGYTGEFYVHPSFKEQYKDFEENAVIKVGTQIPNYNCVFKKADLIITDYSSVAFDFSLLKKPVIYTQFDHDVFYENHTSEIGYFSYELNGFGPVFYDYDTALEGIISQIRSGCQMEDQYQQRVDKFFAYHDRNNCQRVYQAILDIDKE